MRTSPFFMGIVYGIMGVMFTYLAIESANETVWNFTTILLMVVATFDFIVAIRFMTIKRSKKQQ